MRMVVSDYSCRYGHYNKLQPGFSAETIIKIIAYFAQSAQLSYDASTG